MCGIVAYIGKREIMPVLIDGLKRLEYRGYDSCGIAVVDKESPRLIRALGRIRSLEEKVGSSETSVIELHCGIGHTRWATHGKPSETNAHPHRDCTGKFLVAHNGIIENYMELRSRLIEAGHRFETETDTEVLPHLVEESFQGNLEEAVRIALRQVQGVYAVVVVSTHDPDKIVAARKGPPIVIGIGENEHFVASDASALLPYTRNVVYLNDSEIAVIRQGSLDLSELGGKHVSRDSQHLQWAAETIERDGYAHFMLKEIFEQSNAIHHTLRGRVGEDFYLRLREELGDPQHFQSIRRMCIVACGTSYYAALAGKFMIEALAPLHVEVDYASEFRYRNPRLDSHTMVIAISQSGETADTLAAMKLARDKGSRVLSICNVVGSTAARESDSVLYTRAGPEIGVASTKAFTTQLVALYLLALYIGSLRSRLTLQDTRQKLLSIARISEDVEKILQQDALIAGLAERFVESRDFLYLGRGISYPIAMEGALKLKETAYVHAEGFPAGEMKHGPIALIDSQMPVMTVVPKDSTWVKTMSNLEEVRVRGGIVVAVATEGDTVVTQKADYVIWIPKTDDLMSPILSVVPLQLFAYHSAVLRGCDVDKPRNLAKSVTVE